MYDYNASYLNEQATLLEEFHKIQRYLIEHPLYQIYQSSADYVAGVNEYYINEVSVREGSTLGVGDVVLFSNVYYGVITEIDEETEMFTIADGISFRGAPGATGATGETGATGAPGQDGTNGTDGKNGLSIYLYDGAINDTLTTAYVAQINVPTGHTVKTGDILFSTLETSYGAMSLVTSDADDFSTLVSIDYIGKVAGASSDKVIRDIDGSITASALENISVSTGTASNGVAYIRAFMKGEVTYTNNTHDTINYYIDLPIKAGDGVTIEAQPLEGGTGNKQLVISASGGGGGVSDVQINGTSIVADGVANIPPASQTANGVMTTSQQDFTGNKYFHGRIRTYSSTNTSYYISLSGASGEISFSGITSPHFYYNGAYCYLPTFLTAALGGTLMATERDFYYGTSGSVTLPSAGLYEFKVTDANGLNHSFIVNWDGSTISKSTISLTSLTADAASAMIINISAAGVVSVSINDLRTADGGTDTSLTIFYRRIGKA